MGGVDPFVIVVGRAAAIGDNALVIVPPSHGGGGRRCCSSPGGGALGRKGSHVRLELGDGNEGGGGGDGAACHACNERCAFILLTWSVKVGGRLVGEGMESVRWGSVGGGCCTVDAGAVGLGRGGGATTGGVTPAVVVGVGRAAVHVGARSQPDCR